MIKVLQIGFTSNYGGVEACIMNYYRHIDRSQIQFGFTDIWEKDIAYKDEILSLGGEVHKVKSWSKNPLLGMRALKKLINDNDYDIVHFNMNSLANIFQFIAADRSNAKTWLIHAHTSGSETTKLRRILQRLNSRFLDKKAPCLCACSDKAAQFMYRYFHNHRNIHIINNAINLQKLKLDTVKRDKLRALYNLDNCFVIGHIGRFCLIKNHTRLIDIFHEVYKRNPNTRLVLIGDGELRSEVEKKVEALGLGGYVLTLGMIPDAYEYYNAFDVFVFPSIFEGLPLVGIEAQAAGLPTIISDTVTDEMKITDKAVFLPLLDSDEKWADAILQYKIRQKQEDERKQIRRLNMDIKHEVVKLQNLYRTLLARAH